MTQSVSARFGNDKTREFLRWAIAALVVVGVHASAAAYLLASHHEPEDVGGDIDAVIVELAPTDSTPDAVVQDVAPAPETMVESKPVPQPQEQKQPDDPKIEIPPDEAPALVPTPVTKPVEKAEDAPPPAPITAQRVKGGAARIETSWQTELVRQLQRNKRYPADAQSRNEEGVVFLSFSVDRYGRVLAHSVVRSSGHADLDNAAMAMIRRAAPLPPFPAGMPQAKINLTVPVRFALH